MRAAVYNEFQKPLSIQNVPDPTPSEDGVVIRVKATGLCRSDWHGWKFKTEGMNVIRSGCEILDFRVEANISTKLNCLSILNMVKFVMMNGSMNINPNQHNTHFVSVKHRKCGTNTS